ncbi:MAG TPA: transporter [Flavobacteriales bacterium]|jgi:uncharacterized membrane protein YedE/YeeE|nr:transporter [Flavobacteriales bacterium]
MKFFKYIIVGFFFGFSMYKLEAISFFRIYEMFHFQSFHMYGIIMSAIAIGIVITQLFKRGMIKTSTGETKTFNPKAKTWMRYILGGTIFGVGWALTGVCSGMMFVLLGAGYTVFAAFLASAMLGTFFYGMAKDYLPH